jgi:hypothetical protein
VVGAMSRLSTMAAAKPAVMAPRTVVSGFMGTDSSGKNRFDTGAYRFHGILE